MTLPTPISVLKSPRPLEESNLVAGLALQFHNHDKQWLGEDRLLAPKVCLCSFGLIVEIACIFDGDLVPDLGLVGAIALSDDFPCDSHYDFC